MSRLPNLELFTRYFFHYFKLQDPKSPDPLRTRDYAKEQYDQILKGVRTGSLHPATCEAWNRACSVADRQ